MLRQADLQGALVRLQPFANGRRLSLHARDDLSGFHAKRDRHIAELARVQANVGLAAATREEDTHGLNDLRRDHVSR